MQVVEAGDGLADGGDDLGVCVAQNGAHLSGGEVQDLPSVTVADTDAVRGGDDRLGELAGVSEQVLGVGRGHVIRFR